MPSLITLALLLSLLMPWGGPAYAQESPQDAQEETPEAETAPHPEAPKQISTVIIDGNRLSVEFANVTFGEILRSISQKAGFRLEGISPASNKKITTKFNDVDIGTGLARLFSMAQESNYIISYDAKGSIAQLQIPTPGLSGKTSSYPVTTPGGRRRPSTYRRGRALRFSRPAAPGNPAQVQQPESSQPDETGEDADE